MALAFVDTSIAIYATGGPHPLREPCRSILIVGRDHPGILSTSSEVYQELAFVFGRRHMPDRTREAILLLDAAVHQDAEAVLRSDVMQLLDGYRGSLSTRDRLHLAVARRRGLRYVISSDRAFESAETIERLDPATFAQWRGMLELR